MPLFKKQDPKPKVLKVKRNLGEEAQFMSPAEMRQASGMWEISKNRAKKQKETEIKPRKIKYNKKASGGVKMTGLQRLAQSVFGKKSSASGAKGRRAGNTSDSFQCTPTSKSRKCGPNAK